MEINWSKAPGAQWYCQGDFYKRENRKWYWSCGNGQWIETDYASPENFGWWGHRIPAPKPWNGEGLPPVGMVCEIKRVPHGDWGEAIVRFSSSNVIVWDWADEPAVNGKCTAYAHEVEFRPTRTPEQIAKEQLKREFEEIRHVIAMFDDHRYAAEELLSRGYRKQEPKPE